MFVQTTNKLRN